MSFVFTQYEDKEIAELKSAAKAPKKELKRSDIKLQIQKQLLEASRYMYIFEGFEPDEILKVTKNLQLIALNKDDKVYSQNKKYLELFRKELNLSDIKANFLFDKKK